MAPIYDYLHDFLSLFYPDLCAGCNTSLMKNEYVICTNCIYQLPLTNFHKDPENKLSKQLWGRFQFQQASSFVFFRKGGHIQRIMHQLKYNNRPEAGLKMGELYGYQLASFKNWEIPDVIIPVPLHPARQRKRGYNQSEFIARGLSTVLEIPVILSQLVRTENTETQTKKSRFARYENLKTGFRYRGNYDLTGKHVLLVDDVVTTGATLEACSNSLLLIEGTQVSIATLAFAE